MSPLLRHKPVPVYWHESYRPPLTSLESSGTLNPRRSDFALWYLLDARVLRERELRRPSPAAFEDLARVHTPAYLEALLSPITLAGIYSVDPSDIPVDALLDSVRLGCGGTIEAAREALREERAVVNLSGGFHHAGPDRGGGFCAINDIAVAIATLRSEGFRGRVAVLDLDAHPPDGTAACLAGDEQAWLASLSSASWGELGGVLERVLPAGAGDAEYEKAVEQLLAQLPPTDLFFVVAGGDVLAGDPLGGLGLSLEGARARDDRVRRAIGKRPSVWLAGGGYHRDAWRVLAGTVLVLSGRLRRRIPDDFEPLTARFRKLSRQLNTEFLRGPLEIRQEDVDEDLRVAKPETAKLLGFYTPQGLEYGLFQFGILPYLRRVGYQKFEIEIRPTEAGDRASVYGHAEGKRYLLIETCASRRTIDGVAFLFVNWLSLRNPRASFSAIRPKLPGQEVPGLGIAREISEILARIAGRLGLAGVVFRPAWYHLAAIAQSRFRFLSAARQGRFDALMRDMKGKTLLEATNAIAEGRVWMNGEPYAWEADDMVFYLDDAPPDTHHAERQRERDRVRFEIRDTAAAAS